MITSSAPICLFIITTSALYLWWRGVQVCAFCGVSQPCARWLIAALLPKAILVLAVHIPASVSLMTEIPALSPPSIACTYVLLSIMMAWLLRRTHVTTCSSPKKDCSKSTRIQQLFLQNGLWIPTIVVVATYMVFTADALTRYPTGYDGLHYHLPAAVRWLQTGAINLTFNHILHCYPDNAMFVPMLLLAAGYERIVSCVFIPQAVLIAALGYAITRALRRGPRTSLLVAVMSAGLPIVIFQSASSYIDLYVTTTWLTGLLSIIWASRVSTFGQRKVLIVLAGVAAGMAMGGKTTYLALSPLLGFIALCMPWVRSGQLAHVSRGALTNATAFFVPMVIIAGFWFARGTVQANNPIYPLTFEVGGEKILPGFVAKDWYPVRTFTNKIRHWWAYPWHEAKRAGHGYPLSVNNGLGAAFATFVPPAFILAWLLAITTWPSTPELRWQLILVLLSMLGIVLLLTAFQEMLRFVLPFVIISIMASATWFRRLLRYKPQTCIALLSLALLVNAATSTIKPASALASRIKDDRWNRSSMYNIPSIVDKFPSGSRILNLAKPDATYALLGASLASDVMTLDQWFSTYPDHKITHERLRKQSIDYLFAGRGEPMPTQWINDITTNVIYDSQNDDTYASIYPCRIYQVTPSITVAQSLSTNNDLQ